jgi:hypothetical protein
MNHRYTFHINKKYIQNVKIGTAFQMGYNYDNIFKEIVIQPEVTVNMIGQTMININYLAMNRERFRNIWFDKINRVIVAFETTPVKGVRLSVLGNAGRFIYRTTSPVLGKGYDITSEVTVEPTSWLKSAFSWSAAKLSNIKSGSEFYNGHILRNITTLQFSRKLFLRHITQYNTFSKTFSLYPLISYKFNAFTMFCAGMTQDLLGYDQEKFTFKTVGYQYFVKLQYLFHL